MYRRIRDLREDRDLQQIELGKRDIPTEVLIQLSAYYRTSVDYLLGLTDQSAPYPRKRER